MWDIKQKIIDTNDSMMLTKEKGSWGRVVKGKGGQIYSDGK